MSYRIYCGRSRLPETWSYCVIGSCVASCVEGIGAAMDQVERLGGGAIFSELRKITGSDKWSSTITAVIFGADDIERQWMEAA